MISHCARRSRVRVHGFEFRGFLLSFGMNIDKILNNDAQLLAVTGLYRNEFDELLSVFKPRWIQAFKHFTLRGKRRKKPLTPTQIAKGTGAIAGVDMKLLFILNHFKVNAIQQNEAISYDLDQPQVSRWIKLLKPILHQAIVDLHCQAARTSDELIRLFRNRQHRHSLLPKPATTTLNADATERPLSRNVDRETQKKDFSGKQGTHTLKNTVVCDEFQFIVYVGYTWRGAIHDKAMIEQELPDFAHSVFHGQSLLKDTGYQGYNPDGIACLQPMKKKKGVDLTPLQKRFNSWISSLRVVVENAIGGVKRLRVLKDRTRGFTTKKSDLAIEIGVGLHNFRVTRRQTTYPGTLDRMRANLLS